MINIIARVAWKKVYRVTSTSGGRMERENRKTTGLPFPVLEISQVA
jgi:hypothetical protein